MQLSLANCIWHIVCVCFVQNYTALFIFKSYNQDKCYKSCNHMHHQQIMVWVWKVKTMEQSLFNLYDQQGETALQINVLCFNLCRRSLQISLLSYIPFSLFQVWSDWSPAAGKRWTEEGGSWVRSGALQRGVGWVEYIITMSLAVDMVHVVWV